MRAHRIVKSFDVSEYIHHSMFSGGEMAQVDTLAFETTEEVFCNGVVVGVALTGHTLAEMKVEQTLTVSVGGVLDAAVGVEDETGTRLTAPDSHIEGIKCEAGINAVRKSVTDDLLCAKIFDNGAIEPALIGGDIGNIANPCHIGLVKGEVARKEIGRDGMGMPGVCGSLVNALAGGGNAQFIHQAVNAFARAGEFLADHMIKTVKPQCRIALMERQHPAFESLILLHMDRIFAM